MHPPQDFSGSESDPSVVLPDHALENILARIPLPSLGATRCVSKRWRSLTTSATFPAHYSQIQEQSESWLYVNGFRYNVSDNMTSYPCTLSSTSPTPEGPGRSWGAGGLVYVLPAVPSESLTYKLSVLDPQWLQTPALPRRRAFPILGAIKNLKAGAHKVIIAGGLPMSSDPGKEVPSKVELFDSESNTWEECEDLPSEFQGLTTSRSVAAAVCNRKLYLFHIYSGIVTSFDAVTKRWSTVKTLRPPGMEYCYLAVRNCELLLVGVSIDNSYFLFRGWQVDHASMECMGHSWPVLCHFASLHTPMDAASKKEAQASAHLQSMSVDSIVSSPVPFPVVCKLLSAVAGGLTKRLSGVIEILHNVIEFWEAIS